MSFARTTVSEQTAAKTPRTSIGLEQGTWIQADRGPLYASRVRTKKQLHKLFGPRPAGDLLFLAVERALDNGGGPLHIGRLLHYTDPTNAATVTAVAGTITFQDQNVPALKATFTHRELGVGTNTFSITVAAGTAANTVKITISSTDTEVEDEVFDNLTIGSDSGATYFATVINDQSEWVTVVDENPIVTASLTFPADLLEFNTKALAGGSNGMALNDASKIGDAAAGTGMFTLDPAFERLEVRHLHWGFEGEDSTVIAAALAYAEARKTPIDVEAYDHADDAASITARTTGAYDSSWGIMEFARPQVFDVQQGKNVFLPVLSESIPRYQRNADSAWLPPAGNLRGTVAADVTAISLNVGARGLEARADALIEAGINPLIVKNGRIRRWGNETLLLSTDDIRRHQHARNFLVLLDRLITPAFDDRFFDINNPQTWKDAYYNGIRPILAQFVGTIIFLPDGTTLDDIYQGDIDVVNVNDPEQFTSGVNTPDTVADGFYNVKISPLALFSALSRPIGITIEATKSNVVFSEFLPS